MSLFYNVAKDKRWTQHFLMQAYNKDGLGIIQFNNEFLYNLRNMPCHQFISNVECSNAFSTIGTVV